MITMEVDWYLFLIPYHSNSSYFLSLYGSEGRLILFIIINFGNGNLEKFLGKIWAHIVKVFVDIIHHLSGQSAIINDACIFILIGLG